MKRETNEIVMNSRERKRQLNVEMLRCFSMICIVCWHYLVHGDVLKYLDIHSKSYILLQALATICSTAVNCYILITGYFSITIKVQKKEKFFRIIRQISFYSIVISAFFVLFQGKRLSLYFIISSIFPVLTGRYWFITCYLALFLLVPYLNILIHAMGKKQYQGLLILCLLIGINYQEWIPFLTTLSIDRGYGILWFIILYLFGAYIRLYINTDKIKNWSCFLSLILCIIVNVLFKYHNSSIYYRFMRYNNLDILAASILIFLSFLLLRDDNIPGFLKRSIQFFSPLTLGVYLIHDNELIRNILWDKLTSLYINVISLPFPIFLILSVGGVFLLASFFEKIRQEIFRRLAVKRRIN